MIVSQMALKRTFFLVCFFTHDSTPHLLMIISSSSYSYCCCSCSCLCLVVVAA